MGPTDNIAQWIIGFILVLSSLGVIVSKKPVHSSLSFLLTLLALACLYLQLSASFIAIMQILVYAGAILVIFMFVVVLFQDAYLKIEKTLPKSNRLFLIATTLAFVIGVGFLGRSLFGLSSPETTLTAGYGSVQALGHALYLDFFFPFEAVILIFLVAIVGALYIGRKAV